MIPFLQNVADTYYKEYGNKISRFTFVFPNRRAGVFFQHYLSQIVDKPLFSPEILTVTDLFERLSPYKKADRIEMLFMLYDIYISLSKSSESFDEFLYWGDMLLNDFDDVDKYLADAKQLFTNIIDIKEIDAGFEYLTDEQVEAIRRFWSNFLPVGNNDKKQDFLELWKVLYQLYTILRKQLKDKGLAYEGMMYRDIVERAINDTSFTLPFDKLIFVGLNGHSKSEEQFLKYLEKKGIADFYWDYESPLVSDRANRASHFLEKNKLHFPSKLGLKQEKSETKPKLKVVGIPSSVGQAKYAHSIIQELIEHEELLSPEQAMKTAVILPDENLLLPTLYSLPEEIDKINVTMGYSLNNSSISGLMNHIFDLQHGIRSSGDKSVFYFRPVLSILNHRYIMSIAKDECIRLREWIIKYNRIVINEDELHRHEILKNIFQPITDWKAIPEYLKTILSNLNKMLFASSKSEIDREDKDLEYNARTIDIETEFIVEYYKTINKMEDLIEKSAPNMSVETFVKLTKKLIQNISVPFTGEPLSGLQVMGVLETRSLDFENLIILSMNEGIFPMRRATNSFIPYNLRLGFELPTYEHQDSIFAYHFYRMIYRAKNIYLLYDTRTDGLQTGEVSRYFSQIKHLYDNHFDIEEKLAVYKVSSDKNLEISINKTQSILNKLEEFKAGGTKSLSASSINTYIDCPLKFYLSYIEDIDTENEDVDESIEASTFGTIFHHIMEDLYEDFIGRIVTADVLLKMANNEKLLTKVIEKAFAEKYFMIENVRQLTGQNYLTGEVLRKYVKKVLVTDARVAPFTYVQSEKKLNIPYPLKDGKIINLKGFIDRIDNNQNSLRIIDYKSGLGDLRYKSMDELFDKAQKRRPKAVMQVFMYALLYRMEIQDSSILPGIYFLRNLFDPKFVPNVIYRPDRTDIPIEDFSRYEDDFKEKFDECIMEIFDTQVPFSQSETGEACQWCSFANICKK